MKDLPPLPASLTELRITDCSNLEQLPEPFPATITMLDLQDLPGLKALPEALPAGIEIEIIDCPQVNGGQHHHFTKEGSLDHHTETNSGDRWYEPGEIAKTASMLNQAADSIDAHFPDPNTNFVIFGRDAMGLVAALRYRGRKVQYFMCSRKQLDMDSGYPLLDDRSTQERWRNEVPPGSVGIDTGYNGSVLHAVKGFDPTMKGWLLSSNGMYGFSEIPGLNLDRGELVRYIERFPKPIGRSTGYTKNGGAITRKGNRDREEEKVKPKEAVAHTESLLRAMALPENWVNYYRGFTGLRPEERLGVAFNGRVPPEPHRQRELEKPAI